MGLGGGFWGQDVGLMGGMWGWVEMWGFWGGVPLTFDPIGATPDPMGEAEDIGVTEGDEEGTKPEGGGGGTP